ncbi:hypothetical protein KKC47_00975, partial [Patescibacteria group bacterium]|nr:hypothetical protein [Patescibacteria group bacterium]
MTNPGHRGSEHINDNLRIIVQPGREVRWSQFQRYPPFSIALDGFCVGPTRFSKDGQRITLDHHRGVNDVAVRATCGQAREIVKQGLYDDWRDEAGPRATMFVNDCDQDVCAATFVLMNPDWVGRPLLRKYIGLEDHLDSSSGLYLPDNDEFRTLVHVMSWIHEPYTTARLLGELHHLSGESMLEIIRAVHERIRLFLFGHGQQKDKLDYSYELLAKHEIWSMIRETGSDARLGLARDGIRAFVSYLGEDGGGYHRYSIGRRIQSVPFPVREILECLNEAEGIRPQTALGRWGGGSNRGGSPRIRGSKLTPSEVETVVENCIQRWRSEIRQIRR